MSSENKQSTLQQMQDIVQDLQQILKNEELLWHVGEQTHPEHFDFSGMAGLLRQAHQTQQTHSSSAGASSHPPKELGRASPEAGALDLPANQKCTLCADRIYATRRFFVRGKRPILVVHFEGPFGNSVEARDRSQKLLFSSREEDELFGRMVGRMGMELSDLHFQQLPACHFVAETSTAEDWNERTLNCLTHLEDTIARENIKLALITGPAAVLLFGEEGAKHFAQTGEIIDMPVNATRVAALVVRSPAALLSLEHRTKMARNSGEETYQKARQQEMMVKKQIVASLEKAFSLPGLG